MSLIVALDPNVLLAATEQHPDSIFAIRALIDRREECRLGLDPQNKIWAIYTEHKHRLSSNEKTRAFITVFFSSRCTRIKSANLTPAEQNWLVTERCDAPVEPELLAVANSAPGDACMIVLAGTHQSRLLNRRGTDNPNKMDKLHHQFPSLRIWPVRDLDRLFPQVRRSRYPGDEEQLRHFIDSDETEFVEFKQPGKKVHDQIVDGEELTSSIRSDAFEAVCAMLNTQGGLVAVGVNKEGSIIGVDPVLKDKRTSKDKRINDDELSRWFSDEFRRFRPSINHLVKPAIIPLANNRRVILLHVLQGEKGKRYSFDSRFYDRCGPSSRKS